MEVTIMWLTNFPKVRIQEYPKGFVVEIQKRTWYGKKYWTHIISVSGIADEPWYFKTYDYALENAIRYFRWDVMIDSECKHTEQ